MTEDAALVGTRLGVQKKRPAGKRAASRAVKGVAYKQPMSRYVQSASKTQAGIRLVACHGSDGSAKRVGAVISAMANPSVKRLIMSNILR